MDPTPVIPLEYSPSGGAGASRTLRLLSLAACACGVIACLLIMLVDTESVLLTGPVVLLLGAAMLSLAIRRGAQLHIIAGAFHAGAPLLFFSLVQVFHWGPGEARGPFLFMGGVYSVAAIGLTVALELHARRAVNV